MTVTGMSGARAVLEREAIVSFVPGRAVVVPLHLVHRCIEHACAQQARVCSHEGCVERTVDMNALGEWTGGPPDDLPGSPPEAGNGATDNDGSTDTAPEAAVVPDQDPGTADDGGTNPEPDPTDAGSEEPPVGGTGRVDVICREPTCAVRCNPGAPCAVRCNRGSQCGVDCRGSNNCTLRCEPESRCVMLCDDNTRCRFAECSGADCEEINCSEQPPAPRCE